MSWRGFRRPSVSVFLVNAIKSTFLVGFSCNLHSLSIPSIASILLILKKKSDNQ